MRTSRILGLGVFIAATATCGGDGGSGPSQSELVGTWQVTKCEWVSTGGLGSVDLIAGGGSGTLVLTDQDTLELHVTSTSGAPPVDLLATYEIRGIDLMRVQPAGATWYWAWDMSLSGNTLTLSGGGLPYDVNQDGVRDDGTWNLVMTK